MSPRQDMSSGVGMLNRFCKPKVGVQIPHPALGLPGFRSGSALLWTFSGHIRGVFAYLRGAPSACDDIASAIFRIGLLRRRMEGYWTGSFVRISLGTSARAAVGTAMIAGAPDKDRLDVVRS